MRYNRSKHKLLKKLSVKFIENIGSNQSEIVGMTFTEIDLLFGNNITKREMVFSDLEKSDEIFFFNLNEKGCVITEKNGLSAVAEKKYLNKNKDIILGWVKNFVQIFIPIAALVVAIASLIIAYLALTLKINTFQEVNSKKIDSLEVKIKTFQEANSKKFDSLEVKTTFLENKLKKKSKSYSVLQKEPINP